MAILDTDAQQEGNESGIYSQLRQNILELRLKPGAIMSIKDICEHFNVGRSPARDALIHLEQEGLIAFLPQRGTMISKIDLVRADNERFLRMGVEEKVMEEFIASHTSTEINRLEMLIWEQEACLSKGDIRRFMDLDDAFHDVFYENTGREFCANTIKSISGHYRRMRLLTCTNRDIAKNVVREHGELLTSLRTREIRPMMEAFNRHLSRFGSQKRTLIEKYPDLFVQSIFQERKPDTLEADFLDSLL